MSGPTTGSFALASETSSAPTRRGSVPSSSSFETAGVQMGAAPPGRSAQLTERRRQLQRVVVGALGGCGLILVAAAGAQVARASARGSAEAPVAMLANTETKASPAAGGEPDSPTAAGTAGNPDSPPSQGAGTPPGAAPDPEHAKDPGAAGAAAPSNDAPTIGTLRIHAPALPGHVWLDGQKVTEASTVVSCGKHELRIGAKGKARSVTIPCGGELRASR